MTAIQDALQSALPTAVVVAVFAPVVVAVALGLFALGTGIAPSERVIVRGSGTGLVLSLLASLVVALGGTKTTEVDLGPWIHLADYEVPLVFLVDGTALVFSLLAAALTALVARFSATYLHKEPGFLRFYVLLGLFSTGTQLIALGGALDLLFLGWELVGLSSTLFIGFFHERHEPVRSSLRAFVTYRVCDAGFLFAIVSAHELLGSTRLSALSTASPAFNALTTAEVTGLALLFLLASFGKSAQLPFSGWLPRAMEGPTPSSALFYGAVSIHAGLLLLLRVWPVLDRAPIAEAVGVVVGLSTALYATAVARTCNDAKGALAHATLAQVGLILAEISVGLTELALAHLTGHALLRVWQYLRAPNMIHDAHRTGVAAHAKAASTVSPLASKLFAGALFRLRLDEWLDRVVDVVLAIARGLQGVITRVISGAARPRLEVPMVAVAVVVGSVVAVVIAVLLHGSVFGALGPLVFAAAAVGAVIAGLVSMVQSDLRGLYRAKVGVHMGFLVCALAGGVVPGGGESDGAVVFAALTSVLALSGFGFVVHAVERRCGPVSLLRHGGRWGAFPHLGAAFAVIGAAGVGLPGSVGFVADDLLLHAAWSHGVVVTGFLIAAAVFLAVGTLRAFQRVFLGPMRRSVAPDLRGPERVVVVVVVVAVLAGGVAPGLLLGLLP